MPMTRQIWETRERLGCLKGWTLASVILLFQLLTFLGPISTKDSPEFYPVGYVSE